VVLGWVGTNNVDKQTQYGSSLAVIVEVTGGWLVLLRTSSLMLVPSPG